MKLGIWGNVGNNVDKSFRATMKNVRSRASRVGNMNEAPHCLEGKRTGENC